MNERYGSMAPTATASDEFVFEGDNKALGVLVAAAQVLEIPRTPRR